jgi:predicted lipoprotein with Yx(FWY)xxD motif
MNRHHALLATMLAAAALAGCGDDEPSPSMAAAATPDAATTRDDDDRVTHGDEGVAPHRDGDGPLHVDAPRARSTARAVARGVEVKAVRSQFGRILANGRGLAFYYFERETSTEPRCYGDCAEAWPPVFAKGRPTAGDGAKAGKIGVTRRRDGRRQVTYDGHPVYYYVSDAPGRVLCHDVTEFGGRWVVIRPNGTAVP